MTVTQQPAVEAQYAHRLASPHLLAFCRNFVISASCRSLAAGKMTAALSRGGRHRRPCRHRSCLWPPQWNMWSSESHVWWRFWHHRPETWTLVAFEWVVCTTARVLCLKQGLWLSCSWPLTCLDPAQMNGWDFVPPLDENSLSVPPHDDAALILWGHIGFFKFHVAALKPHRHFFRNIKTPKRSERERKSLL